MLAAAAAAAADDDNDATYCAQTAVKILHDTPGGPKTDILINYVNIFSYKLRKRPHIYN